ncbi:hypothetical protein AURDEDRAFT_149637 [Auricularia subglabra TFB-10046 SS5]|nr:hypothetical protein AURDEDRAFT_149637 [Auricularia subglabra TFB-10046 SS5]
MPSLQPVLHNIFEYLEPTVPHTFGAPLSNTDYADIRVDAYATLRACALVCRAWRWPAQVALFRTALVAPDTTDAFAVLRAQPDLAPVVRSLGISRPDDTTLKHALELCTSISAITINSSRSPAKSLSAAGVYDPVRTLGIARNMVGIREVLAAAARRFLRLIDLHLGDFHLDAPLRFTHLRELHIDMLTMKTMEQLANGTLEAGVGLEVLRIVHLGGLSLQAVRSFAKTLRVLDIYRFSPKRDVRTSPGGDIGSTVTRSERRDELDAVVGFEALRLLRIGHVSSGAFPASLPPNLENLQINVRALVQYPERVKQALVSSDTLKSVVGFYDPAVNFGVPAAALKNVLQAGYAHYRAESLSHVRPFVVSAQFVSRGLIDVAQCEPGTWFRTVTYAGPARPDDTEKPEESEPTRLVRRVKAPPDFPALVLTPSTRASILGHMVPVSSHGDYQQALRTPEPRQELLWTTDVAPNTIPQPSSSSKYTFFPCIVTNSSPRELSARRGRRRLNARAPTFLPKQPVLHDIFEYYEPTFPHTLTPRYDLDYAYARAQSYTSLRSFALVCRAWRWPAQAALFRVALVPQDSTGSFLEVLRAQPDLGCAVRLLGLSCPADDTLKSTLALCTGVSAIIIYSTQYPIPILNAAAVCPSVRTLGIALNAGSGGVLEAAAHCFPGLVELHVSDFSLSGPLKFPCLRELHIGRLSVQVIRQLARLSSGVGLETLRVGRLEGLPPMAVRAFSATLRVLDIYSFTPRHYVNDYSVAALGAVPGSDRDGRKLDAVVGLHALRLLRIRHNTAGEFPAVLPPSLEILQVHVSWLVRSPERVKRALGNCDTLRSIVGFYEPAVYGYPARALKDVLQATRAHYRAERLENTRHYLPGSTQHRSLMGFSQYCNPGTWFKTDPYAFAESPADLQEPLEIEAVRTMVSLARH